MNKLMKISVLMILICFLLLVFLSSGVLAAENNYPKKPIKLVVPYNPGGGSDISARIFAKYSLEYFGQPLIVVNISGAGGSVGGQEVLNSNPDGYTLFWHHAAMHVSYHTGIADFTWDSFTPICQTASVTDAIIVSPDAQWNTIEELMTYIKENPGKLKLGVTLGATTHFEAYQMDIASGGDNINIIACGGDADKITKLLGGHVDAISVTISSGIDFIKAGEVKALAITALERNSYIPNIPTIIESGFDVVNVRSYNVFAPKGLSQDISDIISKTFEKMTKDERIVKELTKLTITPAYRNQEQSIPNLLEEDATYYKITRFAKFKGLMK